MLNRTRRPLTLYGTAIVTIALATPKSTLADESEVVRTDAGAKIDEFFSRLKPLGFNGAVLVATGDGILLRKGYGFADRANGTRNSSSTAFGIASLDKQFTAAAILVLEQTGKVSVDDAISRHLDGVPKDKSDITIHQLLTHTSGLRNRYRDQSAGKTFEEFIDEILSDDLVAPPGTRRVYSNSGYNLLEHLVEKVAESDYEAFLKKHLFTLAGMDSTGQHLVDWQTREKAKYQQVVSRSLLRAREPARPDAFLSFRTTLDDFHKWHRALQDERILTRASKKKMFQPGTGGYGYGWFIGRTSRDTAVLHHGGFDTAVDLFAMFYRYPEEDMVAIVFANTTMGGSLNREHLSVAIERMIFGQLVGMPPEGRQILAERLQRLAGTYKLATGGKMQVSAVEGRLIARTRDADVKLALVYPDSAAEADKQATDPRIADVFDGFDRRDFEPLRSVLWESVSFDRAKAIWEERWNIFLRSYGPLESIRTVHEFETEYRGKPEAQTHLLLRFQNGSQLVRAIADPEGRFVFDLINLPKELELPLVALSENKFAAWNLRLQMGPELEFQKNGTRSAHVLGRVGRTAATLESSDR